MNCFLETQALQQVSQLKFQFILVDLHVSPSNMKFWLSLMQHCRSYKVILCHMSSFWGKVKCNFQYPCLLTTFLSHLLHFYCHRKDLRPKGESPCDLILGQSICWESESFWIIVPHACPLMLPYSMNRYLLIMVYHNDNNDKSGHKIMTICEQI